MNKIETQFIDFHAKNPHVYKELVALAYLAQSRGRNRFSINMLFEVVRWNRLIATTDDRFKLNNNYRAYYARLIMQQEPTLNGLFELRETT